VDLVIAGFFQVPSAPPAEAAGGAEPDSHVPDAVFASLLDLAARDALVAPAETGDVAVRGSQPGAGEIEDVAARGTRLAVYETEDVSAGASRAEASDDAETADVPRGDAAPPTGAIVPLAILNAAPRPAGAADESIGAAPPDDERGERTEKTVLWHTVPVAAEPTVETLSPSGPAEGASRPPGDVAAQPYQRRNQEPEGPADVGAPVPAVAADLHAVAETAADPQAVDTPAVATEQQRPRPRAATSLARALASLNDGSSRSGSDVERDASVDPQGPPASAIGVSRGRESAPDASTTRASQAEVSVPLPLTPQRLGSIADLPPPSHTHAVSAVHHTMFAAAPPTLVAPALDTGTPAADDREVVPQLVRAMRTQFRAGIGEARIRLHPEHLGEVRVSIRIDGDRVSALLQVERADVQRAIESQSDTLRAGLTAQGFTLEHLSVRQEDAAKPPPSREDGDARGQTREQATPQRRGRKRQPDRAFELEE
jgi:flagellar hook-length control protein FliK